MSIDFNSEQKFSGLAIHDDAIYFHELNDKNIIIPLEEGCVLNGKINDFDMLEAAFVKLRNEAGEFNHPISIGIPPNDAVIRPIKLPRMNPDDIYSTINLNLDEYFPFSSKDAVFDTMTIKTPNESSENMTVLIAAARISTIDKLLEISRKAGIPVDAIEPLNFAVIRSVPELESGLCIFADANSITTTWNGDGILFRVADNLEGSREIMNTIQYITNQYRQIHIDHLIFEGLDFNLNAENAIYLDDKFLAAKGLAMRNVSRSLDLRPRTYIEAERRRHSFYPKRAALIFMILSFSLLSIGTIGYSVMKTIKTIDDIERTREHIQLQMQRRTELSRENSRLEGQKRKTQKIIQFLQSNIPVLEVMSALESNSGTGIKLDDADFSRNDSIVTVVINGKADDEASVISLTEGLKASGDFSRVMLPISQKDRENKIAFKLILVLETEKI